jgi:futalosine hydrolase
VRVLVVTAVEAELAAVGEALAGSGDVVTAGVGPAAAAAGAALALARGRYDLVVSAGIGGGFAPMQVGEVAVASDIVFADLGAETADGFMSASQLGFGVDRYPVDPAIAARLAAGTGGRVGTIATVATVTGTATSAAALQAAYPDVVAEAMEGAGVAAAGAAAGVPFAEIRAVSNLVGPRDRTAWRIDDALGGLARAVAAACRAGWLA